VSNCLQAIGHPARCVAGPLEENAHLVRRHVAVADQGVGSQGVGVGPVDLDQAGPGIAHLDHGARVEGKSIAEREGADGEADRAAGSEVAHDGAVALERLAAGQRVAAQAGDIEGAAIHVDGGAGERCAVSSLRVPPLTVVAPVYVFAPERSSVPEPALEAIGSSR